MNLRKISLTILTILPTAGAALAQEADLARSAGPAAANQAMACQADQHVDGQLAFIKAELRITQEQEPVWSVFAESFRADKQRKTEACFAAQEQARKMTSASLLDSMKLMETRLSEQLDSLRSMEAAIQPLYGMLSKDQRKKADEILRGGPGM
ncbi:Spy/CpxP family protein refolding chaperone [Rhodoblastus sp.]|jgi:hypothetical protein|uniref:Spy/CpxP family protein refolding chaperone n=1 Tax=Rhodoblastus sp. TaxID=1962975 RepID=UPI00262DEFB8|nr:Spy/CpxP family protein refolding chaperone [Rhodoblastus sp.]